MAKALLTVNAVAEEEARTKWCPFARMLTSVNAASFNRARSVADVEFEPKCIASACMAWRWIEGLGDGVARGYCGLAGTPP